MNSCPKSLVAVVVVVVAMLLVTVKCETKKSWKPAQPLGYLRRMHTQPEMSTVKMAEEETTRLTRSLDTTTFEGTTEQEINTTQDQFRDFDDEGAETVTDESEKVDEDPIRRGVRLLVTGRGKKNNWVEKLVPLFILPFLIQSAIVPFIVQTIKLLLLKSLFVGKTALLLFLLGVFKNMSKNNRAGGGGAGGVPYYLKEVGGNGDGPDDRLYHPGLSGSYSPEIGYRVDGRPANYVSKRSQA